MNVVWRQERRIELYAARKAMTAEQRQEAARKIAGGLDDYCLRHKPELIGIYWPIKFEPNLLTWARACERNLRFCLPVVVTRGNRSNIGSGRQVTRCGRVFGASRSRRIATW